MNLIETITTERDKLNRVLDILNGTSMVLPGDLVPKRKRGRPPKNREFPPAGSTEITFKRKRGRPKGSKNRDTLKPVLDAIIKPKPHWTQTPEGRAKQRRRALKAYRTGTGFATKGGRK